MPHEAASQTSRCNTDRPAGSRLLVGWLGLVPIGASGGHWAATDWFLHWVMRNSVRTAALGTATPPLEDPAMLPLGAGHFEVGCAVCHGSPAQDRSAAALAMLPPPPVLSEVVPTWTDAQLFENRPARCPLHRHALLAGAQSRG